MDCRRCMREIDADAAFCAFCGASQRATGDTPFASKRLERSISDRRLAGVCGGLAVYFEVDSTPIRLLWVVLSICPGAIIGGVVAYGVAWLVMPVANRPVVPETPPTPPQAPAAESA